jgi:predicted metal-dependent peptidase
LFGQGEKGEKDETNKEIEKEWKKRLIEGSEYAKNIGNLPKGMERFIDQLLEDKLNWKVILQRQITNELVSDYSWAKRNRRSIATNFYMPSFKKENIEITVFVDVSGSISQEELKEFLTEIHSIGKYFENLRINLVFWDTKANNKYLLSRANLNDLVNYKINGGGGTDFKGTEKYISEKIPNTRLLIFFTDGYATFEEQSRLKTLWILTKNGIKEEEIPYGTAIKLER